jgi:soluble lytic murein transglycosylase-like protein
MLKKLYLLTLLLTPALACGKEIPPDLYAWTYHYANSFGLEPDLLAALIWTESRYCIEAKSSAGAIGLGQIMPGTATYLGINANDPVQNIYGAAKYLREQWDTFGDWYKALAAYNAGPGNVKKYNGIPPFRETQNYVTRVLTIYNHWQLQRYQAAQ